MFAGTFGPDEWVDSLAPVDHMSFRVLHHADRIGISHYTCVTRNLTVEVLNVTRLADDDLIASIDTFDVDDLDAAAPPQASLVPTSRNRR